MIGHGHSLRRDSAAGLSRLRCAALFLIGLTSHVHVRVLDAGSVRLASGPKQHSTAMADPLSIAASVAGLIGLSQTVFQLFVRYIHDQSSYSAEFKSLAHEIKALCGVLCLLQPVVAKLSDHHDLHPPGAAADYYTN